MTNANLDRWNSYLEVMNHYAGEKHNKDQYGAPFVTISRQVGAGGHVLAEALRLELAEHDDKALFKHWHIFDKSLCETLLTDTHLKVTLEDLMKERFSSDMDDFLASMLGSASQDDVYKEMSRIIRVLAKNGRSIIVGRGGNLLTKDLPMGIHVRVVAPLQERIERMASKLNINLDETKASIEEQDEFRRVLVEKKFGKDIDDPCLYDVVWNTATTDVATIAVTLRHLIEARHRDAIESHRIAP